jgi:hypothetical protein
MPTLLPRLAELFFEAGIDFAWIILGGLLVVCNVA